MRVTKSFGLGFCEDVVSVGLMAAWERKARSSRLRQTDGMRRSSCTGSRLVGRIWNVYRQCLRANTSQAPVFACVRSLFVVLEPSDDAAGIPDCGLEETLHEGAY